MMGAPSKLSVIRKVTSFERARPTLLFSWAETAALLFPIFFSNLDQSFTVCLGRAERQVLGTSCYSRHRSLDPISIDENARNGSDTDSISAVQYI
jgi:hypothetical protein